MGLVWARASKVNKTGPAPQSLPRAGAVWMGRPSFRCLGAQGQGAPSPRSVKLRTPQGGAAEIDSCRSSGIEAGLGGESRALARCPGDVTWCGHFGRHPGSPSNDET